MNIPVYKPYLNKDILKYAYDALDSTWISSHGKYIEMSTEKLKDLLRANHVILTNNGTSATHLVALALHEKYPNVRRIIVPSNVYVAAWNMFKIIPGFELWPIDADIDTWNTDSSLLPNLNGNFFKDNSAILSVHNLGNPVDVLPIKRLYPHIPMVEDNCEGFLGEYNNMPTGTFSYAQSVSFFGNKNITSGEGGAFITNDDEIADKIYRAHAQGVTDKKFIFDGIGYNYRMTNVQAAILYGQLERMEDIMAMKEEVFNTYKDALQHELIHFQKVPQYAKHSNWMFGIRIDASEEKVAEINGFLNAHGVETRPMFPPIYYHSQYGGYSDFPVSEKLYKTCIILPSSPELSKAEIITIAAMIKSILG